MAKQTGVGARFFLDEFDLSGDVGSITAANVSRALLDVTGIDKDAPERRPGIADASAAFTAYYNPSGEHAALSSLGTASVTATFAFRATIGAAAMSLVGAQANYNGARGQDGSFVLNSEVQLANGSAAVWGYLHTSGAETIASAGTAASTVDGNVATSGGAAAVIHATSISSGTATVKIQDSADDSSYADVTGLSFTVSAAGAQRTSTAAGASIRQYTRLVTTGTFSNLVAAVNVIRG